MIVTSTIANGRIAGIESTQAQEMRGVIRIVTHLNALKEVQQSTADSHRGDFIRGLSNATTRIDAIDTTPIEYHNPREPHTTVAIWDGGNLTLYDSTQYVSGVKNTVAKTLGIKPDHIRVICP